MFPYDLMSVAAAITFVLSLLGLWWFGLPERVRWIQTTCPEVLRAVQPTANENNLRRWGTFAEAASANLWTAGKPSNWSIPKPQQESR